jgi:hypothetical protein
LVEPGEEVLSRLAVLEAQVELLTEGQREAEEFFERAVFPRKRIYGPIDAVLLSRPAPAGREA